MKVLVTGARGLLGRTLLKHTCRGQIDFVAAARQAGRIGAVEVHPFDLLQPHTLARIVIRERPDAVIHTAALTDVDRCQTEPELARRVNGEAVSVVADACARSGAAMVHLSTDYVFDGTAGPYGEEDPTRPLSHYGQVKLESESPVLALKRGLVVRTLWLYGHIDGVRRNLVTWPIESLARGERLRIVEDQWGNPTCAVDLARALIDLVRSGAEGLFHFGGATFLTRLELVLRVAAFFGLDASGVEAIRTASAGQVAPRPLRSGLRSERVSAVLGRQPLSLEEGLQRLARLPRFRRDFPTLLPVADKP